MKKLKEILAEQQMSQYELAEKLHVRLNAVNRWANGKAKPNLVNQRRLEKVLKCKIEF